MIQKQEKKKCQEKRFYLDLQEMKMLLREKIEDHVLREEMTKSNIFC